MNQQRLLSRLAVSVFLLFGISINSVAQSIVSVNNLTGTAYVNIPVHSVTVGDISVPIGLSYSASGLKVEDYDISVGMGWRLNAYSSIIRQVKGFPDDVEYQSHSSYSTIRGWLRSGNSAPQTIQSLSLQNDNSTSTCNDEISDASTIASNFSYTYDTEPDVFYVNAPGLSCSFIFDGSTSHLIKILPYRDYKITYTSDSYGRIEKFTVVNENGLKYYFDLSPLGSTTVDIFNPGSSVAIDPATLEVYKRDFMMYRNKANTPGYPLGDPVKYRDTWYLSKIEDTRGNRVQYNYDATAYYNPNPTVLQKMSYKEVEILTPNGSGGFTAKLLYGITNDKPYYRLASISVFSLGFETGTLKSVVSFTWGGSSGSTEEPRLLAITIPEEKRRFDLIYTRKFIGPNNVWYSFGRYFLKGVRTITTSNLCDNVYSQFDFEYYAVSEAANTCYCTPVSGGTAKDTIINAQDYWGYYNGNFTNPNLYPNIYAFPDNSPAVEVYKVYDIAGYGGNRIVLAETSDRSVNSTHVMDGSLKKITYPTGATTELEYESNTFYDNDVSGNVLGNGIRIKKITEYDGINNSTPEITNYEYNDPANGTVTTGRAVSVPKYAMAFENGTTYSTLADRVKNSTYKTTYDMNDESKEILYGKVTVSKSGIGKSIYEYNTSGTFGNTSATDWEQTMNYIARTNLSSPTPCNAIAPSFLINGYLQYPFNSNPNFDFERGLLTKVTQYNNSNSVVASEEYTYDRSHTNPEKIYALKLDDIGATMVAYGKYWINTTVDNFLITKTSKLYNSNTSTPLTQIEEYEYTAKSSTDAYRLLKRVKKQNSEDPAKTVSQFKYAIEYAATTSTTDPMNKALRDFNTNSHRNPIVETLQFREETGPSFKYLGGSINTFREITIGDPNGTTISSFVPDKSFQFANPAGLTSFTESYISSNIFTKDAAYNATDPTEMAQYNLRGVPQVITDHSRIPKTILSTHLVNGVKVAEFVNAKAENVGYSNYDEDFNGNFTTGGNTILTSGGRASNNCLNFEAGTKICRTVTKHTTAKNVVISFWVKDAAGSGNIYVCYQKFGGDCSTFSCTTSTNAIAISTGSQWKYYQIIIPWPSTTVNTLSFSLGTSVGVKIDDVLIYPDNANVATFSHTTSSIGVRLLTAKTGLNGVGHIYEYDKAGRLWITRDQFENILEVKKYKLMNRHTAQIPSIAIGYPNTAVVSQAVTFTAGPPMSYETGDCDAPVITYTWDFGDGGTGTSYVIDQRGNTSIQHTYSTTGKYQISVTASSPGMSNTNAQTPAVTSTDPVPFEVFGSSPSCSPGGTPVICASGLKQYTSTGTCFLYSCSTTPSLPYTCDDTYFKLTGITSGSLGAVSSVEWEINYPDISSTWYTYQAEISGTGGYITSYHFHIAHTSTYRMRAKIKFCDNSTAYSNQIEVKVGDY